MSASSANVGIEPGSHLSELASYYEARITSLHRTAFDREQEATRGSVRILSVVLTILTVYISVGAWAAANHLISIATVLSGLGLASLAMLDIFRAYKKALLKSASQYYAELEAARQRVDDLAKLIGVGLPYDLPINLGRISLCETRFYNAMNLLSVGATFVFLIGSAALSSLLANVILGPGWEAAVLLMAIQLSALGSIGLRHFEHSFDVSSLLETEDSMKIHYFRPSGSATLANNRTPYLMLIVARVTKRISNRTLLGFAIKALYWLMILTICVACSSTLYRHYGLTLTELSKQIIGGMYTFSQAIIVSLGALLTLAIFASIIALTVVTIRKQAVQTKDLYIAVWNYRRYVWHISADPIEPKSWSAKAMLLIARRCIRRAARGNSR